MRRRPCQHRRRRSAFTLVELLVLIGIVAVLIGILLPVLSGIAARGRDLQCQSNIRQCVTLILNYAVENKGQLPYAFYYAPSGTTNEGWGSGPGPAPKVITVWSIISRMTSNNYSGLTTWQPSPSVANDLAPVLRCPEAALAHSHLCAYVVSLSAFAWPAADLRAAGVSRDGPPWKRLRERPTKTNQLLPFTALMWETNVTSGMDQHMGYVAGYHIDGARIFWGSIAPQYRYYSPHDPFSRLSPGIYGNNKPIVMDDGRPANGLWHNIDPPPDPQLSAGIAAFPYQGNLRFRHRKNTTCNVGYSDGHVGQFTGRFKPDGRPIAHDALRKSFMVKWPKGEGIGPDPSLPH